MRPKKYGINSINFISVVSSKIERISKDKFSLSPSSKICTLKLKQSANLSSSAVESGIHCFLCFGSILALIITALIFQPRPLV